MLIVFFKVPVCCPRNFGMASPIFISKHLLKKEVHPFRDGASGIGIVGSWSQNVFRKIKIKKKNNRIRKIYAGT